ncbi:Bpu10I family restriction endonuclease [Priestia megaterium]|uniref:Bpu10I family restriction endonuclease n=1 Tax=Priestia megaterium TaxID=1404 RepID=UPI000BFDDA50|nr:Bpu10I family restriction endonuclease [Priestia megaterium]PGT75546.1 restriction endonuclease [Priestia megaterium]
MYVHGDNLLQKELHKTKYRDETARQYLLEIREEYNKWRTANEELKGPFVGESPRDEEIIRTRVEWLNQYKEFVDQQKYAEKFDSRSNLHSSILEEFIYYLFRDVAKSFNPEAVVGKSHTFKDLFINPSSYQDMVTEPNIKVEKKDHDFIIGVSIDASMICKGSDEPENHTLEVAAIAIECKTYLDKTMLEGSSGAAEQLKTRNPNAKYIVVAEWLKLSEHVNLQKYKVDQVYVLRKQKNTDREFRYLPTYQKNPIHEDVILHLYQMVRNHLTTNWEGSIEHRIERGFLL